MRGVDKKKRGDFPFSIALAGHHGPHAPLSGSQLQLQHRVAAEAAVTSLAAALNVRPLERMKRKEGGGESLRREHNWQLGEKWSRVSPERK